ncbi:MAG: hypothetical protein KGJ95_10330, partial [Candidatus Omnitrophica bacterium]|nr:hypothetical protein [Candidatus Omnitrophota bacterium]
DPASGLSEAQSSRMTSHIIAQDISWIPWSRLSLQAGFNYVLSETATPAFTPSAGAVLDAENNYWTVNFSSTFVVDDKSDLNVDYFYYQADDYQNNAPAGLPLGSGAREHGVTATLTRHINPRTSASLKYGYYHYTDALTGGAADFTAQLILATLQVRF